jgi:splicing factor 3B subunit 2
MDQPGLYATFKYMDDDDLNEISALADMKEETNFDKTLWGVVEEVEEDDLPAEEPQQV